MEFGAQTLTERLQGHHMKHTMVSLAMMAGSSLAFAHGCPGEMKKIDEKLPTAKLSAADLTKVKDLRAKGETDHKAGKHTESMASLAEAKKLLGL
jgi:hypothetical protein